MLKVKNQSINLIHLYAKDDPKFSEHLLKLCKKEEELSFTLYLDIPQNPEVFSLYFSPFVYYFHISELLHFKDKIISLIAEGAKINKDNLIILGKNLGKSFLKEHFFSKEKYFNKIEFQSKLSTTPLYHGMPLSAFKLAQIEGGIVGRSSFKYDLKEDFKINYEDRVRKMGLGLLERPYIEYKGICLSRDFKVSRNFGDIILVFDRDKIKTRYKLEVRRCFYDMTKKFSKYEKEEFLILDKKSNMEEIREKVLKKIASEYSMSYENEKDFVDQLIKEFSEVEDMTDPEAFFSQEFHNAYYYGVRAEEDASPSRQILPLDDYLIGFVIKLNNHYSGSSEYSWHQGKANFDNNLAKAHPLITKKLKETTADSFVDELTKDPKFLGFYLMGSE